MPGLWYLGKSYLLLRHSCYSFCGSGYPLSPLSCRPPKYLPIPFLSFRNWLSGRCFTGKEGFQSLLLPSHLVFLPFFSLTLFCFILLLILLFFLFFNKHFFKIIAAYLWLMGCWSQGAAIPTGIFIPSLLTGGGLFSLFHLPISLRTYFNSPLSSLSFGEAVL